MDHLDSASSCQVVARSIVCQSQDLIQRVVEQHKVCIVPGCENYFGTWVAAELI